MCARHSVPEDGVALSCPDPVCVDDGLPGAGAFKTHLRSREYLANECARTDCTPVAVWSRSLSSNQEKETITMATRDGAREILLQVRNLHALPPMPQSTQSLLHAVGDEDLSIERLAALIEESPPVAARVVGVARSAYYGSKVPVRTVSDAIIRVLGLSMVRQLIIGITVSGSFRSEDCDGFDGKRYWCDALVTANLSRALANRVDQSLRATPDEVYLAGLLHNLGVLALVHVAPFEMAGVFTRAHRECDRRLSEIEREELEMDHHQAGAWLASRWNLPREVQCVMEHHHDAGYRGECWPLCLLVGLSSRYARGISGGTAAPELEADTADALGIDEKALTATLEDCQAQIQHTTNLAHLFAHPP